MNSTRTLPSKASSPAGGTQVDNLTTIIENIGQLVVVPQGPVLGPTMGRVEVIDDAAVVIEGDRIAWFGRESDLPEAHAPGSADAEVIDAQGGCVIPGLIDCHTHTVFAGTRENEFVQRSEGRSYVEIAEAGGGIRSTMRHVRDASKEELIALAQPRLMRMLEQGVTTVEIKSGYGLRVEDELKMLEAVAELDAHLPMDLVGTYLAAHTVPPEYEGDPSGYLDSILNDGVLARIASVGLAEFCDVFCERSAFGVEDSRRVLETAKAQGLLPKVHADQITQMGASKLAGEVGAISADHLECIDEAGMAALKRAGTIAVLLPGCSFFLGVGQAPARTLIDHGLPVALATDYNPGSSMVASLPLVMSIACTQMHMTPTEALVAATANAAAAINRHRRLGAIAVGMEADLVVLGVPNFDRFLYEVGHYPVQKVIKNGLVVVDVDAESG